jgi:hypothetical protein
VQHPFQRYLQKSPLCFLYTLARNSKGNKKKKGTFTTIC